MAIERLTRFLDDHQVKYKLVTHPEAFTAMETSHISHISPEKVAKTVIIRMPKKLAMVVLAANHHLDLDLLSKAIDEPHLDIAREDEFLDAFPDCDALCGGHSAHISSDQPVSSRFDVM